MTAFLDSIGATGTAIFAHELAKPVRRFVEARRRARTQPAPRSARTPDSPSPRLPDLVADVKAGRTCLAVRADGLEVPVIDADLGKGLCVGLPGEPPYGGPRWLRTEIDMARWTFLSAAKAVAP